MSEEARLPLINGDSPKRSHCSPLAVVLSLLLIAAVIALGVVASRKSSHHSSAPSHSSAVTEIGHVLSAMRDTSVDPCDDFYQYACGNWIKTNKIPSDQNCYSTTVCGAVTVINNTNILHQIAEQGWPVIDTYYSACLDTVNVDKLGAAPLLDILEGLDTVESLNELMLYIGYNYPLGAQPFFSFGQVVDSFNPARWLIDIGQGGIALPDPSLYTDNATVVAYHTHITNMLMLLDPTLPHNIASQQAQTVISFESTIANFTLSTDQLQSPYAVYNPQNLSSMAVLAPAVNWTEFLVAAGVPTPPIYTPALNVDAPSFLRNLNQLMAATPLPTLQLYVRWQFLHAAAQLLSSPFVQEDFKFFTQFLSGTSAMEPRWQTCVERLDNDLTDIFDRYYIAAAFSGDSKEYAETVISYIKQAFADNLPNVDWMDDPTRKLAMQKLGQIIDLVGYPANWTNYDEIVPYLQNGGQNYFNNVMLTANLAYNRTIDRLLHPVDRTQFQMTPSTDNAYYDPTFNSINFPAGIIQPILFKNSYPPSVNFGGLGATVGHELTHAFDDQGSQYDGTGRLRPWWSPKIRTAFNDRAACFVKQYSRYSINGTHVDGNMTLGENIADNGGVKEAFRAYHLYVADHGDSDTVIHGMTNDQVYWLSYAQGWCTLMTPADVQLRLETDVHSPAKFRVNGPLSNSEEFADAFKCRKGSRMNPSKKCVLW